MAPCFVGINMKHNGHSIIFFLAFSFGGGCYYGETLDTKGSLLELWYSGSELQLALFPESNGSLVSATGVPRDSCGICGTNTPSRTDSVG